MIVMIIATIYEFLFGKLNESIGYGFLFFALIEVAFVYPVLILAMLIRNSVKYRSKK